LPAAAATAAAVWRVAASHLQTTQTHMDTTARAQRTSASWFKRFKAIGVFEDFLSVFEIFNDLFINF
jgi:hypothetical protein